MTETSRRSFLQYFTGIAAGLGLGGTSALARGWLPEVETSEPVKEAIAAPMKASYPSMLGPNTVRLSKEEVDAAVNIFCDLPRNDAIKRYAVLKHQAIKDGKYSS